MSKVILKDNTVTLERVLFVSQCLGFLDALRDLVGDEIQDLKELTSDDCEEIGMTATHQSNLSEAVDKALVGKTALEDLHASKDWYKRPDIEVVPVPRQRDSGQRGDEQRYDLHLDCI